MSYNDVTKKKKWNNCYSRNTVFALFFSHAFMWDASVFHFEIHLLFIQVKHQKQNGGTTESKRLMQPILQTVVLYG